MSLIGLCSSIRAGIASFEVIQIMKGENETTEAMRKRNRFM